MKINSRHEAYIRLPGMHCSNIQNKFPPHLLRLCSSTLISSMKLQKFCRSPAILNFRSTKGIRRIISSVILSEWSLLNNFFLLFWGVTFHFVLRDAAFSTVGERNTVVYLSIIGVKATSTETELSLIICTLRKNRYKLSFSCRY